MDEELKSDSMARKRRGLRSCAASESGEMDYSVAGFKVGSSNGLDSTLRVRSEHMFSILESYGNEDSSIIGVRKRQKKMDDKSDDGQGQWRKYQQF